MSKKSSTHISNSLHDPFEWGKALQDAMTALEKARERVKKLEFSVDYFKQKIGCQSQNQQH